jgi:cytochrome c553
MTDGPDPLDRPWRLWASVAILSVFAFSVLFGFVLLPVIQGRGAGLDAWTSICRALGIAAGSPAAPQPTSDAKAQPTTRVAWSAELMDALARPAAAGGTLAAGCATCHGRDGRSVDPKLYPDLAGQSAAAIYKQLYDYKAGSRANPVMAPMAAPLTEEQMVAVSAYFASFPVRAIPPAQLPAQGEAIERLVARGDSVRGIPACNACHGDQSGGPVESPRLSRQSAEYLATQMKQFKSGARKNDIYSRMRSVAAALTDGEIDALAAFYATTRDY